MSDSRCSGTRCEDTDADGSASVITVFLYIYGIGVVLFVFLLPQFFNRRRGGGRTRLRGRRGHERRQQWWRIMLKVIFLAGTWPLSYLIFMATSLALICFCPRMVYLKRRNAEGSSRYWRQHPCGTRWLERRWLIMLRARQQRILARSTKGCMARLRRQRGEAQGWSTQKLYPSVEFAILGYMDSVATRMCHSPRTHVSGIELLETGTGVVGLLEPCQSGKNFVWAVETLVELQEEELFRHVVAYL